MAAIAKPMVEVKKIHEVERKYAYVLSQKNEKRGGIFDERGQSRNEQVFKPYLNVLFTSSIWWKGEVDPFSKKERAEGRYSICYYDGCTTLFVDDQPRDLETLKSLKGSTRKLDFNYGFCFVDGYDILLKTYMDWASYNEDSPYRVPSVEIKWKTVDIEKDIISEGELMDLEDRVRELAVSAPLKKMRIHGKHLGIALEDPITYVPFSEKTIRIEYRKKAKEDPKYFEKSYNDKTVEIRTWITDGLNNGTLSVSLIPGRVVWVKTGVEILDISGIKSTDIIIDKLVEFSQTDKGGDFYIQLRDLNS